MRGEDVHHGGRLTEAVTRFGGAPEDWLDLSTGINPVPVALPDIPASAWARLPDADLMRAAREAAQAFYGSGILPLPVPGTQAAIQRLPVFTERDARVAIVEPTYGEYALVFRRAGMGVDLISSLSEVDETHRTVVVVNPNNPAGRVVAREELLGLADRMAAGGGFLVVDEAFAFAYEHLLLGWRRRGAEFSFFSPLADEGPTEEPDAVYLPGGYPELHAGALANAARFRSGMQRAIEGGATVYGECGGYMVLGEGLIDGDGGRNEMLGALPLVTSFEERRRTLGYRRITPRGGFVWSAPLTAHEFHYSTVVSEGEGERLFDVADAIGKPLGAAGLRRGWVAGSFMHVIDLAADNAR
jgi:hypothetical protein